MSKIDKYLFMPSFSLDSTRVVSFNKVFIRDRDNELLKTHHDYKTKSNTITKTLLENNIIKREHHNFTISDNAYRNLKRKINWLYYLAKSKKVKTYNGKDIYNFKIGFITLTLPSKQKHPTSYITKELLNPFLTEIRQRTKMENYVWRLEFQKNGNVHYHLTTDTYLDYYLVKKIWNRLLKSKGYIDDYQNKMDKLSLTDYIKLYKDNSKVSYSDIVKNYARNKRENWSQPPSVDCKSVISNSAIASYLSKYFSKDSNDNPIKNELDTDENSKGLRLWFCSRSLSKLNTVTDFCEAVAYDIFAIVSHLKEVKKVIARYATSYYFDLSKNTCNARKWIEMILKKYANDNNYIPSTS